MPAKESVRLPLKIAMQCTARTLRTASLAICAVAATSLATSTISKATTYVFEATLGNFENPPSGSAGTGLATVTFDDVAHSLAIIASFSGLGSPTTVAHIHCCVAPPGNVGVAVTPGTLPGFPVGVTSGTYATTIDLTLAGSYTAAFITNFGGGTVAGAEAALFNGLLAHTAYFNIHTQQFPGGEIRGFLVPLHGSLPLTVAALGLLGWLVRKRKAQPSPA
jgi:CHRD domain